MPVATLRITLGSDDQFCLLRIDGNRSMVIGTPKDRSGLPPPPLDRRVRVLEPVAMSH
jgi:hypothetical protein